MWKSGNLPREREIGIRLMEGNGVERDEVSWVDVSLEPPTGLRVCHHRTIVNSTILKPQTMLSSARRSLRIPFTCWSRAADAFLDTVVFLWTVFVSFENLNQDCAISAVGEFLIAVLFAYAVASGVLYRCRYQPLVELGMNRVVLAELLGLGYPDLLALPFALYSVGCRGKPRFCTNR